MRRSDPGGLRGALAAFVGLLLVAAGAGCTPAADPVPFAAVRISVTGGVAGQFELLVVHPDGAALRLGSVVAAGRVPTATVERLRMLVEGRDFRRAADRWSKPNNRCTDVISTGVAMGELSVSRDETCGDGEPAVVGEIFAAVADAWEGRFAGPLGPGDPSLVPVRVETIAPTSDARLVLATATGVAVRTRPDAGHRAMSEPERDAVRLLTARVVETGTRECPAGAAVRFRLSVAGGPARPDCAYVDRAREVRLLAGFLDSVVGR